MEKKVTAKELASVCGVTEKTISKHASRLGYTENGKKGEYTEAQAVEIKDRIGKHDLNLSVKVESVKTDAEMLDMARQFNAWALAKINAERAGRLEAERKNAVLMHVTKTYTAGEIAKEIGMRSAQELNEAMKEAGIQYKQNGTWIPCADYAEKGFFQIKQQELESGKVIYDRRITQDGRKFILEFFTSDGVF